MTVRYVLTEYIDRALNDAIYEQLEDATFAGRISSCVGVLAFGTTIRDCRDELRSTLEDWLLVGLKLGHPLPVVAGIDLNTEPALERVDTE